MKTMLETIDSLLIYRLQKPLGFCPEEARAKAALDRLRNEIAEKLVFMLSDLDIECAADTYLYPED